MPDLAKFENDLSHVSMSGRGLEETLHEITRIVRRATSNADAVSITLIRGESTFTAAYDGELALHADELQYERGYGPCLDAAQAGQVLAIDDMASEQRWPDYTRNASAQGILASLSVPLPFQSTMIGALNQYAARPFAFSKEDWALGEQAASWSALAVGYAEAAVSTGEKLVQLHRAMASRAVRTGKRHPDGAAQSLRRGSVQQAQPSLSSQQRQAARRRRRPGSHRRVARPGRTLTQASMPLSATRSRAASSAAKPVNPRS